MLAQLPAFISAVMGDALSYELLLLSILVLMLNVRYLLYRGLRWYRNQHDSPERLRAALWSILRN